MAGPMRDTSLDGSHRTKVADPRGATAAKAETNFEYDDNEWDIGIGDLIIDLDADIEKTNEKTSGEVGSSGGVGSMASAGKLAVEHSATVDKGLKMKIKRTKPGTKTSEAKHEIVKSGEQQLNGNGEKHGNSVSAAIKRGSSGHRKDKTRDKHEVNGVVRPPPVQRVVFPVPVSSGPPNAPGPPPSEPPAMPTPATPPVLALPPPPSLEEPVSSPQAAVTPPGDSSSPPPLIKKPKICPTPSLPPPAQASDNISKEMVDVGVGTSVATITEPDCLGHCEPGSSVTLEGIVWHEAAGILVVNVTWRGKTYVGTLMDCTRHEWAPPRFCDSPTSDLDARTPKGRAKRGRQTAGAATSSDLSNFTETRSSVHSKLRSNNGAAKGRRNPGSPTPFVPPKTETTPGKRKPGKGSEEEVPAKKSKPPPPTPPTPVPAPAPAATPTAVPSTPSTPPPSPVLLECPEPNCSKKYKHINGLKYHQSHAHGSADDEETKESAGSLSEADEAPSPVPLKKEVEPSTPDVPAPETPTSTAPEVPTPSPQPPPMSPTPNPTPTPTPTPTPEAEALAAPVTPDKSVIKPGVLRFGTQEEAILTIPSVPSASVRPMPSTTSLQPSSPRHSAPSPNTLAPLQLVIPPQSQPIASSPHVAQVAQSLVQQTPATNVKIPQFKVKPTSVLMPDDKKNTKSTVHKKKSRKSPAGSPHPHPHPLEPLPLGLETGGREDVKSPAYSDISDDGAPVLDPEVDGSKSKPTTGDKKVDINPGQSPHSMQHYNMYPYYGQPPFLVPSVDKSKDNTSDKMLEAKSGLEKEKKEGNTVGGEFQQKMLSQHYYQYGYVPTSFPYNIEAGFSVPMVTDDKPTVIKEEKGPGPNENIKPNLPTTLHVPNPTKIKCEPGTKDKHSNENHQILKESIEMKNQMSPAYMYGRQQQSQSVQQQDDMRRYYMYPERRKEHQHPPDKVTPPPQPKQSLSTPSPKHKEKPVVMEEKKEDKMKQEGVKPTMETQGPPPPPTSSYAYIHHPSYMQTPHYGALPFDHPGHSMYARGINPMIVPGPYPNNPYLHSQMHSPMPRYHGPEDLSRPPTGPPKALDLLQHHASQYYTSHKIHELQERALKSPTPKTSVASASPSSERGASVGPGTGLQGPAAPPNPSPAPTIGPKGSPAEGKDARSPPPQRHVHTHHHTHVGLGYPILGQYPPSFGGKPL